MSVGVDVTDVSYDELVDRLAETDDRRRIVALPDGSVDHYYAVYGLGGERLEHRDELGRQLVDGDGDAYSLEALECRPAGQAVNAALQAGALGDRATVVGHLDHPIFDLLPFETRSMGQPTRIRVLTFDDEEVLFPERAPSRSEWGVGELRAAVDRERLAAADALCCVNAASFPGLAGVLEALGSADPADGRPPLVVDPGAIGTLSDADLTAFLAALGSADAAFEVIFSGNRAECAAAVAATDGSADSEFDPAAVDAAALEGLRASLGIAAAVLHATEEAAVATRDGRVTVEMLEADGVARTTGAGDRFAGGLAFARARGWTWPASLALGNACAARFVATATTGDRETLRSFVAERR